MSALLKQQSHFLRMMLSESVGRGQKAAMLTHIDRLQLKCLREIALNLLRGNVRVMEGEKLKLKRYLKALRCLANARATLGSRKACLTVPLVLLLANLVKHMLQ